MKKISRIIYPYAVIVTCSLIIATLSFIIFSITKPEALNDIIEHSFYLSSVEAVNYSTPREDSVLGLFQSGFNYNVNKIDFREKVFGHYLRINNSPLVGLEKDFVNACKKYEAPEDCTVVLAIARAETDLCKYPPSQQQQNCWGFGGSGPNRYIFNSYSYGIDFVTDRLANRYGRYFMTDPDAMEMTYCGQRESCRSWGEKVQAFMDSLDKLSIDMGFGSLYALRKNN